MNNEPGTPTPDSLAKKAWAAAAVAALIAAAAVWWFLLRPTPLEKAQAALARGAAPRAIEILSQRLKRTDLPATEKRPARAALAEAFLMNGSFDEAEGTFRALAQEFPQAPEAPLGLGLLALAREQYEPAAAFLTQAKALAPADPRPSRALAALFQFNGEHEKAQQEALSLLNGAPDDAEARRALGQAALDRGLFGDATAAFEAVLQAAPDTPAARRGLAGALLGAGDLARAEEGVAALLKDNANDAAAIALQAELLRRRSLPGEAEAALRAAFTQNPARFAMGAALAETLARRQDTEGAQAVLLDIGQRLPKMDEVPPPAYTAFYTPWETLARRQEVRDVRVRFHLASAETYRARYLLSDAEKQVRLALQLSPRNLDALRAWTDLKRSGGDARAWLAAAQEAAALFPDHPELMLDRAAALMAVKQAREALTFAQAAAGACPLLARAHALSAEALLAAGRKEDAAEAAAQATAANEREPAAFLAAGLVKTARGDKSGARKDFARTVELDSSLARAHWELAKVLDQKSPDAAAHRERALELEPLLYRPSAKR